MKIDKALIQRLENLSMIEIEDKEKMAKVEQEKLVQLDKIGRLKEKKIREMRPSLLPSQLGVPN